MYAVVCIRLCWARLQQQDAQLGLRLDELMRERAPRGTRAHNDVVILLLAGVRAQLVAGGDVVIKQLLELLVGWS